jgi:hypothetical protein
LPAIRAASAGFARPEKSISRFPYSRVIELAVTG